MPKGACVHQERLSASDDVAKGYLAGLDEMQGAHRVTKVYDDLEWESVFNNTLTAQCGAFLWKCQNKIKAKIKILLCYDTTL